MAHHVNTTYNGFATSGPIPVTSAANDADDAVGDDQLWRIEFGDHYAASVTLVGERHQLVDALHRALIAIGVAIGSEALPSRDEWTPEQEAAAARIAGVPTL